jgi:hypothetical protein
MKELGHHTRTVSDYLREAQESNSPNLPDGHCIRPGDPSQDGDGYYIIEDHLLQPLEVVK